VVAARSLAAVSATFWTVPFFGLIDLAVPVDRTPGFYDSYLLETGWGVLYTVVVGTAFLALAVRPHLVVPLVQVAVAAGCLLLTAVASGSWAQLAPGVLLLLSSSVHGLLVHRRPRWSLASARPRLDPVVGGIALALVPAAAVFASEMVAAYRHGRPPRDDDTWGIDHWPTQAALGLAIAGVAVVVAAGVRARWPGTAVSAGCAVGAAAWSGYWSSVHPDHAGSAGQVGGAALLVWAVVFGSAVAWRLSDLRRPPHDRARGTGPGRRSAATGPPGRPGGSTGPVSQRVPPGGAEGRTPMDASSSRRTRRRRQSGPVGASGHVASQAIEESPA
jgi:hypothetical protein